MSWIIPGEYERQNEFEQELKIEKDKAQKSKDAQGAADDRREIF